MNRKWFKIGQAAALIGVGPKELRYWESQIPEIKPRRSKGNLRYYHVDELPRLQRIRAWQAEGLSIGDCRELLLTGHLARGLHEALGLETPKAPAPLLTPVARKPPREGIVAAPAPDRLNLDQLAVIAGALKQLHQRLTAPWPPE